MTAVTERETDAIPNGFTDVSFERPSFKDWPKGKREPFILSDVGTKVVKVSPVINQYLRDYQRVGIKFIYDHLVKGSGCILADDMGLGKTIQVIAYISAMLNKTGTQEDFCPSFLKEKKEELKSKRMFLIVSPSSILYNWEDELKTWGYFSVGIFHKQAKDEAISRAQKRKLEVMLTTYETLRLHLDAVSSVDWFAVVFDEAHKIKEETAQVTIAAKKLPVHNRLALTGTPLQNNMEELWTLLDWVNPGCLGDLSTFQRNYVLPIKQGQKFDATKRELATGRKKQEEFASLKNRWFLRRTKDLIREQLPQKDQKIVFCPMTEIQMALYKEILESHEVSLIFTMNQKCDCQSGKSRIKCCYKKTADQKSTRSLILQYLQLLLKVSNHVALLLPSNKQSLEQRTKSKQLLDKVSSQHPLVRDLCQEAKLARLSHPALSGKMAVLITLLKSLERSKAKVLLFSLSLQVLNICEAYLLTHGFVFRRIDGSTRADQRVKIVHEFNKDNAVYVCLISTRAGSMGLNFTGANAVIIFDPSWNPSYDQQAEDRAYRIGQQRNVKVYRLISSGSVEENLYMRQIYKMQLASIALHASKERRYFSGVAGDKKAKGELFGVKNIFQLRSDGSTISSEIITRTRRLENGVEVADYQLEGTLSSKKKAEERRRKTNVKVGEFKESGRAKTSIFENSRRLGIVKSRHPGSCPDLDVDSGSESTSEGEDVDQFIDELGLEVTCGADVLGSSRRERKLASKASRDVFVDRRDSQQLANELSYDAEDSDESDDIQLDQTTLPSHSVCTRPIVAPKLTSCNKEEAANAPIISFDLGNQAGWQKARKRVTASGTAVEVTSNANYRAKCGKTSLKHRLSTETSQRSIACHLERTPSSSSVSFEPLMFDEKKESRKSFALVSDESERSALDKSSKAIKQGLNKAPFSIKVGKEAPYGSTAASSGVADREEQWDHLDDFLFGSTRTIRGRSREQRCLEVKEDRSVLDDLLDTSNPKGGETVFHIASSGKDLAVDQPAHDKGCRFLTSVKRSSDSSVLDELMGV